MVVATVLMIGKSLRKGPKRQDRSKRGDNKKRYWQNELIGMCLLMLLLYCILIGALTWALEYYPSHKPTKIFYLIY